VSDLSALVAKSLREQVYDHLRVAMARGELAPGSPIDINRIAAELGVSRTPLRDALLQLQSEGFVTILPRRGCVVSVLTLEEIRNLYQIIGALEACVLREELHRITPSDVARMRELNRTMRASLERDDFEGYYAANLELHDSYLGLSSNTTLKEMVRRLKQRLYDFPRRAAWVKEWELTSTGEHESLIERIAAGDASGAADHIRNVHWCFEVQEPFIRRYYSVT
jgi:DNA-binding GntR family transcriptional regulator